MENNNSDTICPLPWLHLSAHLDTTMRICCNTNGSGFVFDNEGNTIKLKDVRNVDDYFNLNFFKEIRAQMVQGQKPKICSKCFEVESYGGGSVRQAYLHHYSNNSIFLNTLSTTNSKTGEIKSSVQSLDLSLSNKCNLKCIMCSPHASYIIKKDYDELNLDYSKEFAEGAMNNWDSSIDYKSLIKQISPTLQEFLTTGGEPFLSQDHQQILELIIKAGYADQISLNYHTNCTVKNEKLFELWNHFKHVSVHLSIDAYSGLNEYIRYNTKWSKLEEIVPLLTNHPKVHCEVHSTVQALNVLSLIDLYEWMSQHPKLKSLPFHIWLDHPEWLKIDVLPVELLQKEILKLEKYFSNKNLSEHLYAIQIISYLQRSISENKSATMFEVFKQNIRRFEILRKNGPIESLIPEFQSLL